MAFPGELTCVNNFIKRDALLECLIENIPLPNYPEIFYYIFFCKDSLALTRVIKTCTRKKREPNETGADTKFSVSVNHQRVKSFQMVIKSVFNQFCLIKKLLWVIGIWSLRWGDCWLFFHYLQHLPTMSHAWWDKLLHKQHLTISNLRMSCHFLPLDSNVTNTTDSLLLPVTYNITKSC